MRKTGIDFRNPDRMNIRESCGCESGKRLRNTVRIGKQEEVNVLFNMNNKKTRKIFSTIVIVLVVLAMVVPMILGSLLSIF